MSDKNPYKKGGMFEGASFLLFERAKELRSKMTGAEEILWMHLRNGVSGCKFRRQHPIGSYITDFYCHKVKLIIELDGSIHNNDDTKNNDITRQNDLEKLGHKVIRFLNVEVHEQIDMVLNRISEIVNNILKTNAPVSGV